MLLPELESAAAALLRCYQTGHKAIFLGNGGSAADAEHLAAEFLGRYLCDRDPLPALALSANTAALTSIGNDYGFDAVFVRQLHALASPGDVILGISTSGKSRNVIAALRWARSLPATTIALTGAGGGDLREHADVLLSVPATLTPRVQECHILIGHTLCEIIEANLNAH